MLASQYFAISKTEDDDWFDPILGSDTLLFVDPFLVFKEERPPWADAHGEIVAHFNRAFKLIAEGNMNPASIGYQKALAILEFLEPKELALGYTAEGVAGAGSGRGFATKIASAIANAIRRGIENPRHFEELGVLHEGIGRDRISDIACTILKRRLIAYTHEVANRHSIPLQKHKLYAASFDERRQRWETSEVAVPTNPETLGPILFVPERFLRDLPVLNANDWWRDFESEKLRQDLNYEVMGAVDKKTIIEIANRNPEAVRAWTLRKEKERADPYSFREDPQGVWRWDLASQGFVAGNPLVLKPPSSEDEFFVLIELVNDRFRLFVEEQGGWDLLWNTRRDAPKPEHAAQLLFRGIAQNYCQANNISLDAEVNLGRGPVDFKFSNGYSYRAHLEIKKLQNGKFWDGLEEQLVSYMRSDEVRNGWLMAVHYTDSKTSRDRLVQLPSRVAELARKSSLNIRYAVVDARPKLSASRLRASSAV